MPQGKKYHKTCFLSAKCLQKGVGWIWKRVTNERFFHLLKSSTCHKQWRRTGKVRVEVQLSYFFKLNATYGRLVKATSRPLYLLERDHVAIFRGDWVGLEAGLDRCGNWFPTGIQTPKLPVLSESLYRLRSPETQNYWLRAWKSYYVETDFGAHKFYCQIHTGER
jgi:hypothetical protein